MADYIKPLPAEEARLIEPYLPPLVPSRSRQAPGDQQRGTPFVTLTFTTSLDAMLTHTQGVPTALSGPRPLAMTHLLRSRHAAILVGVGTAVSDDPSLNCRLAPSASAPAPAPAPAPDPDPLLPPLPPPPPPLTSLSLSASTESSLSPYPFTPTTLTSPFSPLPSPLSSSPTDPSSSPPPPPAHHPRPVILDPTARWPAHDGSNVIRLARDRRGLPPLVIVAAGVAVPPAQRRAVEAVGGSYLSLRAHQLPPDGDNDYGGGVRPDKTSPPTTPANGKLLFRWEDVFAILAGQGLDSVMVEGGGGVINALLAASAARTLVDSVIMTIAPTWVGQGGHVVSPPRGCQGRQQGQQGQQGQQQPQPQHVPFLRLTDTHWHQLGEDVVLCGKMPRR